MPTAIATKPASTHYSALNCRPGCTAEELRAAWLALATKYHPDRVQRTAKAAAHAQDAIRLANVAYSAIKRPSDRKAYDGVLALMYKACPTCKGTGTGYDQQGLKLRIARNCRTCNGAGWYCKK
jgi:DnaJ-class molecular chaperone